MERVSLRFALKLFLSCFFLFVFFNSILFAWEISPKIGVRYTKSDYIVLGSPDELTIPRNKIKDVFETMLRIPAEFIWANFSVESWIVAPEIFNTYLSRLLLLIDYRFKKDLRKVFDEVFMSCNQQDKVKDFPYFWIEPTRAVLGKTHDKENGIMYVYVESIKLTVKFKPSDRRSLSDEVSSMYGSVARRMEDILSQKQCYRILEDIFGLFILANYLKKHLIFPESSGEDDLTVLKKKKKPGQSQGKGIAGIEGVPSWIYGPKFGLSAYDIRKKYVIDFLREPSKAWVKKRGWFVGGIKMKSIFPWIKKKTFPLEFEPICEGKVFYKDYYPNLADWHELNNNIKDILSVILKKFRLPKWGWIVHEFGMNKDKWFVCLSDVWHGKSVLLSNVRFNVPIINERQLSFQIKEAVVKGKRVYLWEIDAVPISFLYLHNPEEILSNLVEFVGLLVSKTDSRLSSARLCDVFWNKNSQNFILLPRFDIKNSSVCGEEKNFLDAICSLIERGNLDRKDILKVVAFLVKNTNPNTKSVVRKMFDALVKAWNGSYISLETYIAKRRWDKILMQVQQWQELDFIKFCQDTWDNGLDVLAILTALEMNSKSLSCFYSEECFYYWSYFVVDKIAKRVFASLMQNERYVGLDSLMIISQAVLVSSFFNVDNFVPSNKVLDSLMRVIGFWGDLWNVWIDCFDKGTVSFYAMWFLDFVEVARSMALVLCREDVLARLNILVSKMKLALWATGRDFSNIVLDAVLSSPRLYNAGDVVRMEFGDDGWRKLVHQILTLGSAYSRFSGIITLNYLFENWGDDLGWKGNLEKFIKGVDNWQDKVFSLICNRWPSWKVKRWLLGILSKNGWLLDKVKSGDIDWRMILLSVGKLDKDGWGYDVVKGLILSGDEEIAVGLSCLLGMPRLWAVARFMSGNWNINNGSIIGEEEEGAIVVKDWIDLSGLVLNDAFRVDAFSSEKLFASRVGISIFDQVAKARLVNHVAIDKDEFDFLVKFADKYSLGKLKMLLKLQTSFPKNKHFTLKAGAGLVIRRDMKLLNRAISSSDWDKAVDVWAQLVANMWQVVLRTGVEDDNRDIKEIISSVYWMVFKEKPWSLEQAILSLCDWYVSCVEDGLIVLAGDLIKRVLFLFGYFYSLEGRMDISGRIFDSLFKIDCGVHFWVWVAEEFSSAKNLGKIFSHLAKDNIRRWNVLGRLLEARNVTADVKEKFVRFFLSLYPSLDDVDRLNAVILSCDKKLALGIRKKIDSYLDSRRSVHMKVIEVYDLIYELGGKLWRYGCDDVLVNKLRHCLCTGDLKFLGGISISEWFRLWQRLYGESKSLALKIGYDVYIVPVGMPIRFVKWLIGDLGRIDSIEIYKVDDVFTLRDKNWILKFMGGGGEGKRVGKVLSFLLDAENMKHISYLIKHGLVKIYNGSILLDDGKNLKSLGKDEKRLLGGVFKEINGKVIWKVVKIEDNFILLGAEGKHLLGGMDLAGYGFVFDGKGYKRIKIDLDKIGLIEGKLKDLCADLRCKVSAMGKKPKTFCEFKKVFHAGSKGSNESVVIPKGKIVTYGQWTLIGDGGSVSVYSKGEKLHIEMRRGKRIIVFVSDGSSRLVEVSSLGRISWVEADFVVDLRHIGYDWDLFSGNLGQLSWQEKLLADAGILSNLDLGERGNVLVVKEKNNVWLFGKCFRSRYGLDKLNRVEFTWRPKYQGGGKFVHMSGDIYGIGFSWFGKDVFCRDVLVPSFNRNFMITLFYNCQNIVERWVWMWRVTGGRLIDILSGLRWINKAMSYWGNSFILEGQSLYRRFILTNNIGDVLADKVGLLLERLYWAKSRGKRLLIEKKIIRGGMLGAIEVVLGSSKRVGMNIWRNIVWSRIRRVPLKYLAIRGMSKFLYNRGDLDRIYYWMVDLGLLGWISAAYGIWLDWVDLLGKERFYYDKQKGSVVLSHLMVFKDRFWKRIMYEYPFGYELLKRVIGRSLNKSSKRLEFCLYYLFDLGIFLEKMQDAFYSALALYRKEFYFAPKVLIMKKRKWLSVV